MVWKCKLLILESDEQEFADQSQSELFGAWANKFALGVGQWFKTLCIGIGIHGRHKRNITKSCSLIMGRIGKAIHVHLISSPITQESKKHCILYHYKDQTVQRNVCHSNPEGDQVQHKVLHHRLQQTYTKICGEEPLET